jgi:exopolysaccharide biosynthesis protein
MKRMYFLVLIFSITSCDNNETINNAVIDSLKKVIQTKESEMKWIKRKNPGVIVVNQEASTCAINFFYPFGLKVEIVDKRPDFNDKTFFCVAGAYTSKSGTIDGIFINNGQIINYTYNNELTGLCITRNDSLIIETKDKLNDELIKKVVSEKSSLFQQTLLIKNGLIVDCNIFGDAVNLRRALIKFNDGSYLVGESHRAMSIQEFQSALKEIGAIDAINLDMGSWSEGWYKSNNGKMSIGENFLNTNRQTNWIVYSLK